jgi:hypothetical protein
MNSLLPLRARLAAGEHVLAGLGVQQALVDVHRAARLVLHRLGQEGGVDAVPHRTFAHGALEQEHLVGARQRVGVLEVDFQLGGAGFVDQRIHVQLHRLA